MSIATTSLITSATGKGSITADVAEDGYYGRAEGNVGDGGGANRLCNPGQDARSGVALIAKKRAIRCEEKRVKFFGRQVLHRAREASPDEISFG